MSHANHTVTPAFMASVIAERLMTLTIDAETLRDAEGAPFNIRSQAEALRKLASDTLTMADALETVLSVRS